MQFPQSPNRTQLPLFDAFLPSPMAPLLNSNGQTPWMEGKRSTNPAYQ